VKEVLSPKQTIVEAFNLNREEGKPTFIPFIMGGYPTYQDSIDIALTLQKGGAHILEIGFPYSDPLADGPIIQNAAEKALNEGMSFSKGIALIQDMRKAGVTIPLIIFCYYNPILQYGLERFVEKALEVGANGVLVPDLPHEEANQLSAICREKEFAFISLVAPTSKQRVQEIASQSEGFVYCISSLGVTGVRDSFSTDIEPFLLEVKQHAKVPLAVGFGVSKKEHVQFLEDKVDGIIIGSAIIRNISDHIELYRTEETKKEALNALKVFVDDVFSK
jgi:tryptophan synthase alpha chain